MQITTDQKVGGFESLRARPGQRPVPGSGPASCMPRTAAKYTHGGLFCPGAGSWSVPCPRAAKARWRSDPARRGLSACKISVPFALVAAVRHDHWRGAPARLKLHDSDDPGDLRAGALYPQPAQCPMGAMTWPLPGALHHHTAWLSNSRGWPPRAVIRAHGPHGHERTHDRVLYVVGDC